MPTRALTFALWHAVVAQGSAIATSICSIFKSTVQTTVYMTKVWPIKGEAGAG